MMLVGRTVKETESAAADSCFCSSAFHEKNHDYSYALKLGSACGNATAFSSGLAKREKIYELLANL